MEKKVRKHSRRYLIADVETKTPDDKAIMHAMAVNISKSGISLYAQDPLEIGKKIVVKIIILMKGAPITSEEVPGTVKWVLPVGDKYAAGILFDKQLNKADFPILAKCLEYATPKKADEESEGA